MKKILEVLQYGEFDIRFNTDFDVMKNPQALEDLVPRLAMAMTTSLWGGNEMSVLAMIRSLCIADIGVSVNRKEMLSGVWPGVCITSNIRLPMEKRSPSFTS